MEPKCAAVTGASSGIGEAFARRLAADGFDLLLIARRRERLDSLAAELSSTHGRSVEVLAADLASDQGLAAAVARIATIPGLVMVINNAGFGLAGAFCDVPAQDHDRMHRLHVLSTLHLTHAALRRLVPLGRGWVINVSSVAGFIPSSGTVSYSATKHWVNAFTEGVWLDLAMRGSGVRIQALCPGFTWSEFHDVMPMDRTAIPSLLWTRAEDVVDTSLRELSTGKLFVVPGFAYRILVGISALIPRGLLRAGTVWFARNVRQRVS